MSDAGVRIDRWLWAARFFKTRGLAADAIAGGKVDVNGARAKPSRNVRPGDEVRIRLGPFEHLVTVQALSVRRGPAAEAATLYVEEPSAKARRLKLIEQHKLAAQSFDFGEGKPTKKQRREIRRLKGED
ncbi:MAG TPA: S4 domain-containing protein [Gemmatimonadales bacterium]